ncbi:AAA family ATPase [Pseudobacteroides cellulosolvens]|uniref:Metal dependent phosphohydrolase n=1 Tax=Pseudobacteroides cellulosolvens ATCC 35603 = DSM 2933 TaxID=398512 RepID=A0A0L6JIB6_9FIRM|nr:AAA family ATPase [Pseudobacteroides cellulosolvens]KNY25192.1 metal dependent phosphohydrolase [Pseudobacteroides cellulosolvens ATCC 35603 = DSM 2933]
MNQFIMITGLPGSGKSTIAKELAKARNAVLHSSDDVRQELFGDANNQEMNDLVFRELNTRILSDLKDGKSVVYDATNLNYKKRKAFLDRMKIECRKECVLVATPYEICLERNNGRERKVPDDVIEKMYRSIFIPQYYEGWDHIDIVFNDTGVYNLDEFIKELISIEQHNQHHTLTIGKHCEKCMENIKEQSTEESLVTAALLHDIGKKFTKAFSDLKGNPTSEAHYYGHQHVSAYLSLFYLRHLPIEKVLEITNYIQWHMRPFDLHSGKSKLKATRLLGKDFYDNLLLLHEADTKAK